MWTTVETDTRSLYKAVLSLVFPVSLEEERTVLVKLHLVTNVAPVVCSLPLRSGENGTRRSTLARSKFFAERSSIDAWDIETRNGTQ